MKKIRISFLMLMFAMGLSACGNFAVNQAAEHCGDAVTTVSYWGDDETWEVSFEGSDSAALTDILLQLDYDGDTCKCLPEYEVYMESGAEYGFSLTGKYARHDDRQVSLNEEQVRQIQEILDRRSGQSGEE